MSGMNYDICMVLFCHRETSVHRFCTWLAYGKYLMWTVARAPAVLRILFITGADKSLARPDWKNNWKVVIFRPTQRSLLPRRPGWTDNLLNHRERHHSAIKAQNTVTSGLVISYSELMYNCNLLEPHSELSVAHKRTEQIHMLGATVTNKYRLTDNETQ
jgi:hypothetical protein